MVGVTGAKIVLRIGGMRKRFGCIGVIIFAWILACATVASAEEQAQPLALLRFLVVRDGGGKPVRNAGVVLHPVNSKGKQSRGGLELKTDSEGKCSFDGVPYGMLRVQVLAPGFQTFGEDYDINQPEMEIKVALKRPQDQYSIYEDHPGDKKEEKKPDKQ
jgi:hypothetical protein